MSEAKKIVTLENVVFNYPAGNNALDRITVDLHEGEIVGLVGANGAGKTTLMKILAGYMDKTDGQLLMRGQPVEEFSNKRLNEFVTLVEQNPETQLVGPTVEDELARACRLMGYEGRVIREKVDFVLKLVRMKQSKEWYLDEMSCGERRRIALALCLIADPSVLLLDEPLSDLDQVGVRDCVATLKELKNRGLCIVVSSHRLEDILELTDRLAVLGEGRLLMIDTPQKVLCNDEILKLAAITLPSIQKLFLRLQNEGLVPLDDLPLSLDQAVEQFKDALAHPPTHTLRAMKLAELNPDPATVSLRLPVELPETNMSALGGMPLEQRAMVAAVTEMKVSGTDATVSETENKVSETENTALGAEVKVSDPEIKSSEALITASSAEVKASGTDFKPAETNQKTQASGKQNKFDPKFKKHSR
jgi:energy-coupling factor transporter ATP-binding protein EcfA2